jgi:hypothetical protein
MRLTGWGRPPTKDYRSQIIDEGKKVAPPCQKICGRLKTNVAIKAIINIQII